MLSAIHDKNEELRTPPYRRRSSRVDISRESTSVEGRLMERLLGRRESEQEDGFRPDHNLSFAVVMSSQIITTDTHIFPLNSMTVTLSCLKRLALR